MTTFSLRPEGFVQARAQLIRNSIFIFLGILTAGVIWNFPVLFGSNNTETTTLVTLIFLTALVTLASASSFASNMYDQKVLWNSYRLTFRDDALVREREGYPTLVIPYEDITTIEQNSRGDLVVKTSNKDLFIIVPAAIDYRDEVVRLLSQDKAIQQQKLPSFVVRYRWLVVIVSVGSMVAFFAVNDPWIVVPLGLLIIAFMMYAFMSIRRSVQFDSQIKKNQNLLIVVVVIVLVKVLTAAGLFGSLPTRP